MRWLGIASLFRQTLLLLKRAPPRSGAASSYFTRADSVEWAQGHERAKSTYPDKPTRLCRAGAQSIGVASSSSPPRQPSTGEATARSFSLKPTAPSLLGSDRSAVGRVALPLSWQQNWGSPSHFSRLEPKRRVGRRKRKLRLAISYALKPTAPGGLGSYWASEAVLIFPAPSKHTWARTCTASGLQTRVKKKTKFGNES